MGERTRQHSGRRDDGRREAYGERRRSPRRRVRADPTRSPGAADEACPVRSAIELLQEKWVLHIIHTLLDGPRGFNDLGRAVGGCNPTTLTQRLARLENAGIVVKSDAAEGGAARSVYGLTRAGQALEPVVAAVAEWASLHFGDEPSTLA